MLCLAPLIIAIPTEAACVILLFHSIRLSMFSKLGIDVAVGSGSVSRAVDKADANAL